MYHKFRINWDGDTWYKTKKQLQIRTPKNITRSYPTLPFSCFRVFSCSRVFYYSLAMGKEFYFLSGVFRSLVNVTELVRTYLNISSRKKVLQDFIRESDNNVHFISSVARLSLRIIMISAALLTAIVKLLFEKALYYLEVSFFKVFNNVWLFCDCKVS